jgi:hypothetical protein
MQLDMSIQLYEQTLNLFEGYQESGFDGALVAAKELARELDINADEILIADDVLCAASVDVNSFRRSPMTNL